MKMNVRKLLVGLSVGVALLLSACNDDPEGSNQWDQWLQDVETIDNFLSSAGITAIKDPSGIRMVITSLGTGLPAQVNGGVDVDYVGKRFEDKFVFDHGNVRNNLANLIDGWEAALTKLPAGSEAKVYIPSLLGYGSAGRGADIPPNTILEFDLIFNEAVLSTSEIEKFEDDTTAINQYLIDKSIDAIKDPTGLRYVITQPGAGSIPTWYDKVKFKANFKLLTNDTQSVADIEFAPGDNNYNRVIDQTPHGLKIGLQKLPVGSTAVFYIPSGFGYGTQGASNGNVQVIPPNANIIVTVELTEIVTP